MTEIKSGSSRYVSKKYKHDDPINDICQHCSRLKYDYLHKRLRLWGGEEGKVAVHCRNKFSKKMANGYLVTLSLSGYRAGLGQEIPRLSVPL